MSARVATRAINRLLPYRSQQVDLVTDSAYYEFNNPTVQTFDTGGFTDWTLGADAAVDVSLEEFDGNDALQLQSGVGSLTNSADLYVEDTAGNVDSTLPCTFRVVAKDSSTGWLRIYDPNDAGTDVWFDLTNGVVGSVGVDVIEARVTFPPRPGMVAGNGVNPGEHNDYFLLEFELPAAAARTMRIQLVDGDTATVVNGTPVVQLYDPRILNGKIRRWISRRTGLVFGQATAANQPFARPMGVPQLNGRQAIRFTASKSTSLVSEDSAALWKYLHDGSGSTIEFGWMPAAGGSGTQCLLDTGGLALSTGGLSAIYDATDDELRVVVDDGSSTIVDETTAAGSLPEATFYVTSLRFQDNGTADFAASVGGESLSVANVDYSGATGDPAITLTLSRASLGFDGWITDISIADERWSDDLDARAIEHIEALSACSRSIAGCVMWQRAGEGESGNPIDTMEDLSGNGNTLTSTATREPVPDAASTSLRGSPGVVFDLGDTMTANGLATTLADLTADHALICTGALRVIPTGTDTIWVFLDTGDVDTSESLSADASNWIYTRSAEDTTLDQAVVGTVDLRPHVHSFMIESGERSAYIDGAALFEGVASTPGVMGTDTFRVGAVNASGTNGSSLILSEIAAYDQAPNTYQRQLVERAQRRRMLGGRPLIAGHSLPAEIGGEAGAAPPSGPPLPSYTTGLVDAWLPGWGVTVGTGGVSAWTSQVGDNRVLAQGTEALRPDVISADANFNGEDSIDFDESATNRLTSSDAASVWAFLHAHSGAGVYVLLRPNDSTNQGAIVSTKRTGTGLVLYYDGGNQRARYDLEDQSGNTAPTMVSGTGNPDPVNTTHVFGARYAEGASPELNLATSTGGSDTDDWTTWVDGGNPEGTLRVGDRVNGEGWPFDGQICAILIYDHKPDGTNEGVIMDFLEALGGVA